MGIFSSLFRNSVGLPGKSEVLNNHVEVYKKIIGDKQSMEEKALEDLEKNSDWKLLNLKKNQIDYDVQNGRISSDEWVSMSNQIEDLKLRIIADYIDSQNSDTIYGILREGLKTLKNNNINLPNMNQMEFDLWRQIVDSAELAELTIAQIVNGREYVQASKNDKIIRDYNVRRHFRK